MRNRINFIVTIYIVLLTTACTASAGEQLATGNQAFAEADYDRAAQTYQEIVEIDPVQAEPIYNLANTRYRQGIYTDTHQLLPQAAVTGSEELAIQSYYNQGNAHFQLEDWPAAIEAYKESLRLNPEDIDAKYNLELAMRNIPQEEQQQEDQQDEQEDQDQQDEEQQKQDQQQDQQESSEESEDESEEQQQDQQSESEDQAEQPQQGQPQDAEQQEPLTEEQARQLLRAIGQNTETLQEQMQMVLPAEGAPPEKDW